MRHEDQSVSLPSKLRRQWQFPASHCGLRIVWLNFGEFFLSVGLLFQEMREPSVRNADGFRDHNASDSLQFLGEEVVQIFGNSR